MCVCLFVRVIYLLVCVCKYLVLILNNIYKDLTFEPRSHENEQDSHAACIDLYLHFI